jgi:metal-responsive CopG/Arc/MetJ family transcriptional regulator
MRTPRAKRKASKPPAKLHGQRQPLAVTLPPELIVEIDAIAARESRSRARLVEVVMREFVQSYQRRSAA